MLQCLKCHTFHQFSVRPLQPSPKQRLAGRTDNLAYRIAYCPFCKTNRRFGNLPR